MQWFACLLFATSVDPMIVSIDSLDACE